MKMSTRCLDLGATLLILSVLLVLPAHADFWFNSTNVYRTDYVLTKDGGFPSDGGIDVTQDVINQCGAIWAKNTQTVKYGFQATLRVQVTASGTAADGMSFVVSGYDINLPAAVPTANMGYFFPNNLAQELDIYNNGGSYGDIAAPHMALNSCGNTTVNTFYHNTGCAVAAPVTVPNAASFYSGAHTIVVDYNPASARWVTTYDDTVILNATVNLATLLTLINGESAWVGMVGCTSPGYKARHRWLGANFTEYIGVTGVSKANAVVGDTITLTGYNFKNTNTSRVFFGATPVIPTFISTSQLVVTVPLVASSNTTLVDIMVSNDGVRRSIYKTFSTNVIPCVNGTFSSGSCKCDSGFSGAGCLVKPPAKCVGTIAAGNITSAHPTASAVGPRYENNTLYVQLEGAYVIGRAYKSFGIVGASSTRCSLGSDNAYWTKTVSDCKDQFALAMPWSAHSVCGFNLTSNSSLGFTYTAKATVVYTETVGAYNNLRTSEFSYDVSVTFPTTLIISLTSLSVTSSVSLEAALSGETYSAETKELVLELTTILPYPNKVSAVPTVTTPLDIQSTSAINIVASPCTTTAGSTCVQKLYVKLNTTNSNCVFDGDFSLSVTITNCRESVAGCSSTNSTINFHITTSSVCASVELEQKLVHSLASYSAASFPSRSATTKDFTLGQQVYFVLNVNAGSGNTPTINFVNITFNDNAGGGDRALYTNKVVQSIGTTSTLTVDNGNRYFSLYLAGQVFTPKMYTITVVCEVIYGNRKRYVDTRLEGSDATFENEMIPSATKIHISQSNNKSKQQQTPQATTKTVAATVKTGFFWMKTTQFLQVVGVGCVLSSVFVAVVVKIMLRRA